MITDTIQAGISGTDGTRISGSSQEVGNTSILIDTTLPAASSNVSVSIAWTVANTQALFLLASQNCTILTNSTGSPANTINLVAGIPLIWRASAGYYANPFTTNVTVFYVSCTPATRLQCAILTS